MLVFELVMTVGALLMLGYLISTYVELREAFALLFLVVVICALWPITMFLPLLQKVKKNYVGNQTFSRER